MIPAVIGFIFISGMMGKEMQNKMAEYQNVLEIMSNEAVSTMDISILANNHVSLTTLDNKYSPTAFGIAL